MQCRLFYFYKYDDLEYIDKHLGNLVEPYQIVTDSFTINEYLKKNGKKSVTLRDIFPEEDEITYEIYRQSKHKVKIYRRFFENLTFEGYEIFSGLEEKLLEHIILYEKARKILGKKQNTIFIFENFSFCYFAIMKLAKKLGFTNDLKIGHLQGDKVIMIDKPEGLIQTYKNKINNLVADRFPQILIKNLFSLKDFYRNLMIGISLIRKYGIPAKELFGIMLLGIRFIKFNLIVSMNIDIRKKVLKMTDAKILNMKSKYQIISAFFCTTNKEDLYLKPIYPLLEKFTQEKICVQVFTVDLQTNQILRKRGMPFVDLFEEVQYLTRDIQRTKGYKNLLKKIKQVVLDNNISVFYVNSLSNDLLNEISHSIAMMIICDHIIRQMKNLKSIVIAPDGVIYGNSVVAVAKKHAIPTFSIPAIVVNENPLHSNWYKADKICVYGLQGSKILEKLGYNKERIVVTGNPKYDHIKSKDLILSRDILNKDYGIDKEKKIIVVGMARWHTNDEKWMSNLIKFCNHNDFEIIIKIHPMYKTMLHDESENKIKKIRLSCWEQKYLLSYDMDLHTLIAAADLVITDYSNVGADALLYDKPLLTVNFANENLDNEQRYHELGIAIYFEDYKEMENTIKEILIHGKHLKQLAKGRKEAVSTYNFHNDGQASQRIFNMLLNKDFEKTLVSE